MKLLPEFPGVDGSWQEPTGVDKEGSGQEMAGKGPDRRWQGRVRTGDGREGSGQEISGNSVRTVGF